MSIFRAPLTDSKGDIRVAQVATGAVPAGATQYRGLWVTVNGLVCGTADTGQARKFQGGIAFEASSGLLLIGDGSATPYKMPMDGMLVDANGAFLGGVGAGQIIHQGVNFINQSTGGNPRVNIDDPVQTFYARMRAGTENSQGQSTFVRSSSGSYLDSGGVLRSVETDEARFEASGLLMEQAITNKCENWNANPDVALTNMAVSGDPAAIFSRVLNPEKLREAGLDRVCSSGYVYHLDNTAGSSDARVRIVGGTGNTNRHTASGYWMGSGTGYIRFTQGPAPAYAPIPSRFERYVHTAVPTGSTGVWEINVTDGSEAYFILNQFEEQEIASSTIVTKGVATSRAIDQLNWPVGTPPILTSAQGMGAILVRYPIAPIDLNPTGTLRHFILSHSESPGTPQWFLYARITDITILFAIQGQTAVPADIIAQVNVDTLQANQDALVAFRWVADSVLQIGCKRGGTWVWGTNQPTFHEFTNISDALYSENSILGGHQRDLYLWVEDKGTAWLESFFSGVAN